MAIPSPSTPLGRLLADEIRGGGSLSFAEFMRRCLYDPTHGYYTKRALGRGPGRAGDFFTNVSVGPVLGELLADHAAAVWDELGRPTPFHLIEQGAHEGQLMADLLETLERDHPALARVAVAVLIEPQPVWRTAQQHRLGNNPAPVRWATAAADLAAAPLTGFFFCNELLDAFPVERLRFDGLEWRRLGVGLDDVGRFRWIDLAGPRPVELARFAEGLGTRFPAGYCTEVCLELDPWVDGVAAALERGRVVIIDYARDRHDYFAPHRTTGTLRGYCKHQRCDDPFARPGETDLTADVNATDLGEAAIRAGFTVGPRLRQETFLTRLAAPRLRAAERNPPTSEARAWLRQFQTLVHPSFLGGAFSVVELSK